MKTAVLLATALLLAITLASCQDDTERIQDQNEAAGDPEQQADPPASRSDVTVFDLRAGDCFQQPSFDEEGEYREIAVVPCDEADYRVTNLVLIPDDGSYPGDAAVDGYSAECGAAASDYLTPSEESWSMGDRTIICLEVK